MFLYGYAVLFSSDLHKYVGITVLSFIRPCGNSPFYVPKSEWGSQVAPSPLEENSYLSAGKQLSVRRRIAIRIADEQLFDSSPIAILLRTDSCRTGLG